MRVVFCCDPIKRSVVDEAFAGEEAAARGASLDRSLISFETLVRGDVAGAVDRVAPGDDLAVYRGWMLTPEQYSALYDALVERGLRLINTPCQYRFAHHFPESYADLAEVTPRSVFVSRERLDWGQLADLLRTFGDQPLIVKDWVKSRKHEWAEACFIPSAADAAAVERVARRFVELQGDELAGGLVFRAFEQFEPLGTHQRSGMPLTKEFRLFFLDGRLLTSAPYWEGEAYGSLAAPVAEFAELARRLPTRFFTMDVARRIDGVWRVVEIGDGQVSGLTDEVDRAAFYAALELAR